ncbi:Pyrethroid hydrolase [Hyphodiscus hymeniophilus]|uniref:Pyrethroid hydrolase n=1 Tax=Hyphodiscus hymeniophilus TaxID=353542 RepID=A0A9P7AZR4_9HELO|nr:Pyrethroid hydrolase [Hyphodiscus hymeniophilus]
MVSTPVASPILENGFDDHTIHSDSTCSESSYDFAETDDDDDGEKVMAQKEGRLSHTPISTVAFELLSNAGKRDAIKNSKEPSLISSLIRAAKSVTTDASTSMTEAQLQEKHEKAERWLRDSRMTTGDTDIESVVSDDSSLSSNVDETNEKGMKLENLDARQKIAALEAAIQSKDKMIRNMTEDEAEYMILLEKQRDKVCDKYEEQITVLKQMRQKDLDKAVRDSRQAFEAHQSRVKNMILEHEKDLNAIRRSEHQRREIVHEYRLDTVMSENKKLKDELNQLKAQFLAQILQPVAEISIRPVSPAMYKEEKTQTEPAGDSAANESGANKRLRTEEIRELYRSLDSILEDNRKLQIALTEANQGRQDAWKEIRDMEDDFARNLSEIIELLTSEAVALANENAEAEVKHALEKVVDNGNEKDLIEIFDGTSEAIDFEETASNAAESLPSAHCEAQVAEQDIGELQMAVIHAEKRAFAAEAELRSVGRDIEEYLTTSKARDTDIKIDKVTGRGAGKAMEIIFRLLGADQEQVASNISRRLMAERKLEDMERNVKVIVATKCAEIQAETNPTVLLVHGAYHTSSCFDVIKPKLEALSYQVIALDLPTTNPSSPTVGIREDVEAIHKVMLPLLDAGKEVTVVGHSYGGFPGYLSIEGNSLTERAEAGKRGGVRSMVFICAFASPEVGMALTDVNIGSPPDVSWFTFREDGLSECNDWAKTVLYEDLPERERDVHFEKLGTMPLAPFTTPVDFAAPSLKAPCLYVVTEKDRAITLETQERIIASIPGCKSVRLPCGHSPFLSHPDETVDAIVKGAALK